MCAQNASNFCYLFVERPIFKIYNSAIEIFHMQHLDTVFKADNMKVDELYSCPSGLAVTTKRHLLIKHTTFTLVIQLKAMC